MSNSANSRGRWWGRSRLNALRVTCAACALAMAGASRAEEQTYPCGLVPARSEDIDVITPEQMQALAASQPAAADASFQIQIVPGPNLQANPAALAALQRAAASWQASIVDPITVTISAELGSGGPGRSSTVVRRVSAAAPMVLEQLARDAADERADVAAQRLPELPTPFAPVLPDGRTVSGNIFLAKAAMKAILGQGVDDMFPGPDGSMIFGLSFPFDFDNRDGVTPGQFDFESAARHEIGHVLGFESGLDDLEMQPGQPVTPGALDLFRFEATPDDLPAAADFGVRPRNLVPGVEARLDDIDHEFRLSTGLSGDGNSGSDWKADEFTGIHIGVMDPTLPNGVIQQITAADRRALDLLGYEITAGDFFPIASVFANGTFFPPSMAVPFGTTLRFRASLVELDGDGFGFPLFSAFGSTALISQIWGFGGLVPDNGPLGIFTPDPSVTFPATPSRETQRIPISLTAFDTLGDASNTVTTILTVSDPPTVVFAQADGNRIFSVGGSGGGKLTVRSGQPVQFEAAGADADGLGFPIFGIQGILERFSFQWRFSGGQTAVFRSTLGPNPVATFQLNPGEESRDFPVSVDVIDAVGLTTTARATITVTRSGRPSVSIVVAGNILPPGTAPAGQPDFTLPGVTGPVQLSSRAFDEDGLGFPVFAGFGPGFGAPVTYIWDFGGAQPANLLDIFSPSPVVSFGNGGLFRITLTVFDAQGNASTVATNLLVTP